MFPYAGFSFRLSFILVTLIQVHSITKQLYFNPGINENRVHSFLSDYSSTKVLQDFTYEVGDKSFVLSDIEHAGFYSLKVENDNGSFVDDVWVYHAVPTWMCRFTEHEYLLRPVPKSFYFNRTAVLPCTILGDPKPTFTWEKRVGPAWDPWVDIASQGLLDDGRYIISGLGHLFIKSFNYDDIGTYRCRARNSCGGRCPDSPVCSLEDVIGEELTLSMSTEDSEEVGQYFLNPIINHCWDADGVYYDGADSRSCSSLSPNAKHITSFSQYCSLNSTPPMEALFDFRRMQNDEMDSARIAAVRWKEVPEMENFNIIQDKVGESGICIGEIDGFLKENMVEYYYCSAYYALSGLLRSSARFEFVMKEAPYVELPRGVAGVDMAKIIEVEYGSTTRLQFTIQVSSPEFDRNKIKERWICNFNGRPISNDWHYRCEFDFAESDILQFTIDYAVFGDAGYYQVIAGNDEGWAVGPPILLLVNGTEPENGRYSLTILQVTHSKITVRWNQPNILLQLNSSYTVTCKNTEWEEPLIELSVQDNIEWAEITDLHPGALYAISVTLNGGLVADEKEIRTVSRPTRATVPHLTCSPETEDITCSWHEPPVRDRRGSYYMYNLTVIKKEGKEEVARVLTTNLSTTITNLVPWKDYIVRISPCNELGSCSPNILKKNYKTQQQVPGPVHFLVNPQARDRSVHVSLVYPDVLPGELETEVVRYEEKDYERIHNTPELHNDTDPNVSRHVFYKQEFDIEDLKPSTTYYMKFRWKTAVGPGPFSSFYKLRIKKYVDYKKLWFGGGMTLGVTFICVIIVCAVCLYIKKRWPGLMKEVVAKVRDHIQPNYVNPPDVFDEFHNHDDGEHVVYEFDGPGGEAFVMT